ncbi:MAG: glycine cleavage system aminomethyltransferase GcvT [Bauldia sp.]|nr:glycine cleavage system aminomethyltransferase GcvT [Bauldia sp.]
MADSAATAEPLLETVLAGLHRESGARMVPFAGYAMPVQYRDGIIAEHTHTRTSAGLFDVSHMGQAKITGPSFEAAAMALEAVTPGDFQNLKPGRMRYTLLLTPSGTIVDDMMVSRPDADMPGLMVVFNAARAAEDEAFLRAALPAGITLDVARERSMVALQGPKAATVLARHADIGGLAFMDVTQTTVDGVPATVSRSGYTGEDGFEIIMAPDKADAFVRKLLAEPEVKPIGLGARDTLRLEAGLPLYGHDIDETTTPVEADLGFALSPRRREAGDFPGASRILGELKDGAARKRVGLLIDGRMPAREGAAILSADGEAIGTVTSGGFSPTLARPIAMGYVSSRHAAPGTAVQIKVRDSLIKAEVAPMPFVPHTYFRRAGKGA